MQFIAFSPHSLTHITFTLYRTCRCCTIQPHTVVFLVNGGALAIEPLLSGPHTAAAIIEAFYPGQGGADAMITALLGESNRFGKLPYTMYPSTFIERSVLNFNLTDDGGLTYRHYDGK